jgi:DNA-directed RNA polymerase specialized sigma24 family protein
MPKKTSDLLNKKTNDFSNDAGLIAGIIRKEKMAFSALYDQYAAPLFAVIYGTTGDRLMSEALLTKCFCVFWETAGNYDPQGSGLLAWMLRTTSALARESAQVSENEIRAMNNYVNDSKELINLEM